MKSKHATPIQWLIGLLALTIIIKVNTTYSCESIYVAARSDNPPLSFVSEKKLQGIGVDLFLQLINRLPKPLQVLWSEPLPWRRSLALIKTGQLDAVLGFIPDVENKSFAVLVTPELTQTAYHLFYKEARFPQGLDPKKMGDYTGAITLESGLDLILKQHGNQNWPLISVSSLEAAAKMALSGRTDYFIAPLLSSIHILYQDNRPLLDELTFSENPIATENQYVAFSKKSSCQHLSGELSQQLAIMKKAGVIDDLLGKSLGNWQAFEWYIQNRNTE